MSSGVSKLYQISQKQKRIIIGLMSGTSLDGLDIALCEFEGYGFDSKVKVLNFESKAYTDEFRLQIRTVFSKRNIDLEQVCILNEYVGRIHAALIRETLNAWGIDPGDVDLIASHGQTIYHAPASLHKINGMPNSTLQIGDGDHIAVGTGIITISDFRQKNIAAGGEGAPLAVYGDHIMFSHTTENRILLNIGGISNFTFLPATTGLLKGFSTDVGPGNTLMDAYVQSRYPDRWFDKDGELASGGSVNHALLHELLNDPFFDLPVPRSTGPELFNLQYLNKALESSGIAGISDADLMATLNRFTSQSIVNAIKECAAGLERTAIYTSGGGMHNPIIMKSLREMLPGMEVKVMDELGVHPDAKEAVLFALLGNECLANEVAETFGENVPQTRMGKISLPD